MTAMDRSEQKEERTQLDNRIKICECKTCQVLDTTIHQIYLTKPNRQNTQFRVRMIKLN